MRIPGDTGTRFGMLQLTGDGPAPFGRLNGAWDLSPKHGLRLVIAPLSVSGSGQLTQPTRFAGEVFAAGTTPGRSQFNAYKLT